jgi:thiamine biosynthesis lipoprotein
MKMKKNISVLLSLLCVCSLLSVFSSCKTTNKENEKEYTTRTKTISYAHFNTVSTLSSYGDITDEQFDSYVKTVDEMLGYYHKLFDIYYEYAGVNNVMTVNKNAGKAPVAVDQELIAFLEYCKEMYTLTNGKTNVMFGSVLKIWHNTRELADENAGILDESLLPSHDTLTEAAKHTSMDLLVINKEEKTVYISDPLASLDVGAIAKGYAANKVAQKLKSLGADSMALNAGGNIVTIGLKPDGGQWVTGITNPDKTTYNSLICKVKIGETSLVTSGDYERYFVSGNKAYHHIIDPQTLVPANHFASVSIFTPDSGLADALSTALFCMPYEEGLALVQKIGNVDVIWITADGNVKMTEGVSLVND